MTQIFSLVWSWRSISEITMKMSQPTKTAWLIGLYTNEIEYRIRKLGYRLMAYHPDLNFVKGTKDSPMLVVFSEDQFSDPSWMDTLRIFYPKTVMISVPLYMPSDHPSYHQPSKISSYGSILRLITSIQEMETRWEN
jgi:hypothetical protein